MTKNSKLKSGIIEFYLDLAYCGGFFFIHFKSDLNLPVKGGGTCESPAHASIANETISMPWDLDIRHIA